MGSRSGLSRRELPCNDFVNAKYRGLLMAEFKTEAKGQAFSKNRSQLNVDGVRTPPHQSRVRMTAICPIPS